MGRTTGFETAADAGFGAATANGLGSGVAGGAAAFALGADAAWEAAAGGCTDSALQTALLASLGEGGSGMLQSSSKTDSTDAAAFGGAVEPAPDGCAARGDAAGVSMRTPELPAAGRSTLSVAAGGLSFDMRRHGTSTFPKQASTPHASGANGAVLRRARDSVVRPRHRGVPRRKRARCTRRSRCAPDSLITCSPGVTFSTVRSSCCCTT